MANENRLIDAEAIARKLKNAHCAECDVVRKIQCSACWVEDVLELLEGDAVDAVEVVRCKDCKKCHPWEAPNGATGYECDYHGEDVKPDDFCSCGERREGE